jgi:hypothetical protein
VLVRRDWIHGQVQDFIESLPKTGQGLQLDFADAFAPAADLFADRVEGGDRAVQSKPLPDHKLFPLRKALYDRLPHHGEVFAVHHFLELTVLLRNDAADRLAAPIASWGVQTDDLIDPVLEHVAHCVHFETSLACEAVFILFGRGFVVTGRIDYLMQLHRAADGDANRMRAIGGHADRLLDPKRGVG